jgi:hypothetical protein
MVKTRFGDRNAAIRTGNVWGDLGRGGNQARQNIQNSRIWMDTYTTEGYTWAHTQVYGQTHTQQKDTRGNIHKYMDGHTHNRRINVGTYTSIWVSTCTTKGHRWAHIQVYG